MMSSKLAITQQILTFVFAVVPATGLLFFVGLGIFASLAAVADGEAVGLLFLVWSLAGLAGTAALWAVLFRKRQPVIPVGLILGIFAILPMSYGATMSIPDASLLTTDPLDLVFGVWAISLPLTAVYWVIHGDWETGEHTTLDQACGARHSDRD